MLLRILGSAAAEAWPAPFCVCEACREARRRGGKDIRRRTSYQLGDQVHVDWGPDSYHSVVALSLDYTPLRHLLTTHSHRDHWCPQELAWRKRGFARLEEGSWLTVHGNRHTEDLLRTEYSDLELIASDWNTIEPFAELPLKIPKLPRWGSPPAMLARTNWP